MSALWKAAALALGALGSGDAWAAPTLLYGAAPALIAAPSAYTGGSLRERRR